MKTSPRLERPAPSPRLDNFGRNSSESLRPHFSWSYFSALSAKRRCSSSINARSAASQRFKTSFILLPQGFFKALLCLCRECCVRDFADFFGKLARDFAHVIELLRIAFAKRAHEIMDTQLDPRRERKLLVHT